MNANLYVTKDYENEPPSGPKKTNPKQTQFQTGRPLIDSRNYKKYLAFQIKSLPKKAENRVKNSS